MTPAAAAGRYARALFEVARQENADLDAVQRDLSSFALLFNAHEALHRVLTNPVVPAPRKVGVVDALLARAGGVAPMLVKLLRLLAERDRLALVPDLARAYEQRLMDHRQVVRAQVRTAMALPPDRVDALRAGLSRATGRDVHLETQVDPSIIGGAVTRVGSTVYDGSVARQLERLKQTLIDSAQ
jgi:F-type H+-transporting ATPase subunit delta